MKAAAAPLAAALLAGCAGFGGDRLTEGGPGVVRPEGPQPAVAQAAVRTGAAKAEVAAALGPANVIPFDTGWEVWVYRWPGAGRSTAAATELVVLFDPQGQVRKSRVRPGRAS